MRTVVQFDEVSKLYRLGDTGASLREALSTAGRRLISRHKESKQERSLWALRGVSFTAVEGEALGIIGPNGAGKTTILKLLSKITLPTVGLVQAHGRVSSLIELGAGFHPDLTGRDNIYLNGTILGMTHQHIRKRFDEIVAFSGLERFLDTPVKRYSSGMYARLGFSVAAFTGAKILLVDEVLAVGDLGFQAKCIELMRGLIRDGVTVIFISHSLYYVSYFCHRVLLLHEGEIRDCGAPARVIASYRELIRSIEQEERGRIDKVESFEGATKARLVDVTVLDVTGSPREVFSVGETLVVSCSGFAEETIESPVVRVSIFTSEGVRCFSSHNRMAGVKFPDIRGAFEARIEIPDLRLMPDAYSVSVALLESSALGPYDWREFCAGFRVVHPTVENCVEAGVVHLPHRWDLKHTEVGQHAPDVGGTGAVAI